MKKKKIGFIGNFKPAHSTENDRKWSFEKLGHEVFPLQENITTANMLREMMPFLDLLVYSHTHDPSYIIDDLIDVFREYKAAGVPTVSVHLDRWMGLARKTDMGKEATWFTEYIFMADGSPEAVEEYNRLGLNWYGLKPGVVERDCYRATPDPEKYPHEIVFVGSKGYHPEYPFRPKLIDFLSGVYGSRFGHYGNDGIAVLRGAELNTLYSTAKIAVGDSCFAGTPNYVSDRYYETRGRGGFLLHPKVQGIDSYGVGHYEAGNLNDLKEKIDYFLEHEEERERMRKRGFDAVRERGTYTNRAEAMLRIIGEKYGF